MSDESKDEPATPTSSRLSLEEFSGYTTFHGLHFVISAHYFYRRVIWSLLILAGIVFLGFQLVISYGKLQAYESIVGNKIAYSNEVRFPAFTFCNINMMKKSKIKGTDAQYFIEELNPSAILDPNVKKMSVNDSFDIERAVLEHGHTAKDLIKHCSWNGKICSYRNFTTSTSLMYGLCHTFNSGEEGHQILTSTAIRRENGLYLFIDIEPLEYIGTLSMMSTGIRFFVHDQDTHPMMEEDGVDAMPGFTTSIRLKRKRIISLKPPFDSACGSRKLKVFKVYSTGACLTECYARIITKRCGCRLLGMPVLPDLKIKKHCNPKDLIRCEIYPNISRPNRTLDSLEAVTEHLQAGYSFYPNPNMCDCPKPCDQITFGINLNTAYFPSNSFFDLIFEMRKIPPSTPSVILDSYKKQIRDRYLSLYVSYENLNTEESKERPAYDINDFGSNVGGNLGLFLGCSLLTVCEFIDFILVLLIEKYQKSADKNRNTQEDQQGQDNKALNETTQF